MAAMDTDGYAYIPRAEWPAGWEATVAAAATCFDEAVLGEKQKLLESINSERLQLKFSRQMSALPPPIRACVEVLDRRMRALCGDDAEQYALHDCYALLTPADEQREEARAPQKWHLDAVSRFPVAALVLRGGRATEFIEGPYSDFSAGVPAATLEAWCAPLKNVNALTWGSDSEEEWMHWQTHMHAARLVTGRRVDEETGEECEESDWNKLPVAPPPADADVPGGHSIFWSNKVHRGPGTDRGEERLVLFCAWQPTRSGRKAAHSKKESETDYSYYDTHLEPKLVLSERGRRSTKRRVGGDGGDGPRGKRRQRA